MELPCVHIFEIQALGSINSKENAEAIVHKEVYRISSEVSNIVCTPQWLWYCAAMHVLQPCELQFDGMGFRITLKEPHVMMDFGVLHCVIIVLWFWQAETHHLLLTESSTKLQPESMDKRRPSHFPSTQ